MKKAKFNHYHFNDKHNSIKGIPLVVTYHPLLKSLSKIISKNLYLLFLDEEVKRVFTPGPITETNTFTSTVTGRTYKINHKFVSDENCFVYLLTCKLCGIEYVGQTVAYFCYRWNNYKDNCRKHSCNEVCMQKHLYDHYMSCNKDFPHIVSGTFIDKTDASNPLEREQYWRHTS